MLSIKKYILILVGASTAGMVVAALIFMLLGVKLGFGSQGILVMILVTFPVVQFSTLYGFYKGLVKHYDLKE